MNLIHLCVQRRANYLITAQHCLNGFADSIPDLFEATVATVKTEVVAVPGDRINQSSSNDCTEGEGGEGIGLICNTFLSPTSNILRLPFLMSTTAILQNVLPSFGISSSSTDSRDRNKLQYLLYITSILTYQVYDVEYLFPPLRMFSSF